MNNLPLKIDCVDPCSINPNQSTVSRWFKGVGGFKSKGFYNKTVLLPILAVSLIYKSKVQSNQLSKVA